MPGWIGSHNLNNLLHDVSVTGDLNQNMYLVFSPVDCIV